MHNNNFQVGRRIIPECVIGNDWNIGNEFMLIYNILVKLYAAGFIIGEIVCSSQDITR